MSRALLDPQRIVAAHGAPRDARRAEIVERDRLPRVVAREELLTCDAGDLQAPLKLPRELAIELVHGRDASGRLDAPGFVLHRDEQRDQRRLDRQSPRLLRFRRTHVAGLSVDAPMNVDDAAIEIDVFPLQGVHLAGTRVEVRRDREHAAPLERNVRMRDESEKLRRPQVDLALPHTAIGTGDAERRIVGSHAKVATLGVARVREHPRHEPPRMKRGLPRELAAVVGALVGVEHFDEALDVVAFDGRDRQRAERGEHVGAHSTAIGLDRSKPATLTSSKPSIGPESDGLAVARVPLGCFSRFAFALRREELSRLVLVFLQRERVELRTLLAGHAAGGPRVLLRHGHALSRSVGETNACAEVLGADGAPARLDRARALRSAAM